MQELTDVLKQMDELSQPVRALCGIEFSELKEMNKGLDRIDTQLDKVLAIK
jgi:hypothetical protein